MTTTQILQGLSPRYIRGAEYVCVGAAELPWLGSRAYGGASTVAVSSWSTAYLSSSDQLGFELSAFRFAGPTLDSPKELHELHGCRFATIEDAEAAAYKAGLISYIFWVAPSVQS